MNHWAPWQLDRGNFQGIVTHYISGKRLILIFNESLWLGYQMQHTLLNPNQLRSFGMLVKQYPFASDEPIRIESGNGDAVLSLHTGAWSPSKVQFSKTSRREEEELTMLLIASATTNHGMSTIKIYDLLDIEDFLYSIGQLSHRMLSCVHVLVYVL